MNNQISEELLKIGITHGTDYALKMVKINGGRYTDYIIHFMAGYEVAVQQKWSDEDVKNAMLYTNELGAAFKSRETPQYYLQSLQKKKYPENVELEIQPINKWDNYETWSKKQTVIKITPETNTIIPVKVNYE